MTNKQRPSSRIKYVQKSCRAQFQKQWFKDIVIMTIIIIIIILTSRQRTNYYYFDLSSADFASWKC